MGEKRWKRIRRAVERRGWGFAHLQIRYNEWEDDHRYRYDNREVVVVDRYPPPEFGDLAALIRPTFSVQEFVDELRASARCSTGRDIRPTVIELEGQPLTSDVLIRHLRELGARRRPAQDVTLQALGIHPGAFEAVGLHPEGQPTTPGSAMLPEEDTP